MCYIIVEGGWLVEGWEVEGRLEGWKVEKRCWRGLYTRVEDGVRVGTCEKVGERWEVRGMDDWERWKIEVLEEDIYDSRRGCERSRKVWEYRWKVRDIPLRGMGSIWGLREKRREACVQ
jgi:hypothetical protein